MEEPTQPQGTPCAEIACHVYESADRVLIIKPGEGDDVQLAFGEVSAGGSCTVVTSSIAVELEQLELALAAMRSFAGSH